MLSTLTQSPLAANLAVLGDRNADLVERIRAAAPSSSAVFTPSREDDRTLALDGCPLASRHRPGEEGTRLAATVDLVENAVTVVLGFGAGYHVRGLAERMGRTGLIVVFEPDVALLRTVFEEIDHSGWMKDALLLLVSDAEDRGALSKKLHGAESILAQGITILEHPPSRRRLEPAAARFSALFTELVTTAKTTFVTTLMRTIDTAWNVMSNADHYVLGAGIADLENAAPGRLAVVVSAGPSLRRNMHRLAEPGVRERCVIVSAQTTLKPLLAAGIVPHFVTALDYHEISRRFYEGLTPEAVAGCTLVAEPKAHPAILDAYPGPVRCCASPFMDRILGAERREMGSLPAGATVAHLGLYLARWLGCNPIAMIGQDLAFTDGLYYAPGNPIHDVWAPELNPFNTLAMMEWQRIVRHRAHLHKTVDVTGHPIYTDAQMLTYLQQFERDFADYAKEGLRIIDATEGGVAKQHAVAMPLADVLDRHLGAETPPLPPPPAGDDPGRARAVLDRLGSVERDMVFFRDISRKSEVLLQAMLDDQNRPERMAKHFRKIDRHRAQVEERLDSFRLLNDVNQLGVFKRMKADRRLQLTEGLDEIAVQRAQLERDLENVRWLADAAQEMTGQLATARALVRGEPAPPRPRISPGAVDATLDPSGGEAAAPPRVAALVPIDPVRNGLGIARSLATPLAGRGVLQRTLERLGRLTMIESIIAIAPHGFDLEPLLDRTRIGVPLEIERVEGSPFGPERDAIAAARLWAETCWRGGIGGMSVHDEVLCPGPMLEIMKQRGLGAALLVAPDWPCLDVSAETGCDAVVTRHLDDPRGGPIVFTQAPPGLCGCVVSTAFMEEIAKRTRLSTIGGSLVYRPHAPVGDPIATDANVQIDQGIRRRVVRATADSPRRLRRLERALAGRDPDEIDPATLAAALEAAQEGEVETPRHVLLELTPERTADGIIGQRGAAAIDRPPLTDFLLERILAPLGAAGDAVLTLGVGGDPLRHERFDTIVRRARAAGVRAVHVRTALAAPRAVIDRLLAAEPDVISIDLHADCAATYERTMGTDGFGAVIGNLQHLVAHRRHLAGPPGAAGFALPWIVPRLERRTETVADLESFYERWQHLLGTAVIESPPAGAARDDELTPVGTPWPVLRREMLDRMTILSDGAVPVDETDVHGREIVGNVADESLPELRWRLVARRRDLLDDAGSGPPPLGMLTP